MKKEIKFINYKLYIAIISILLLFLIIFNIMYRVNTVFATAYSNEVYPIWVKTLGRICDFATFSVFEMLIILAILFVLTFAIRLIVLLIKYRKKQVRFYFFYHLKKYLLNLVCIVLVALLVYSMTCGVNYYRLPFSVSANITTGKYSVEELNELCIALAKDANEFSKYIDTDENGVFTTDNIDLADEASKAMEALSVKYPCLTGYYPSAKPIAFSKFMSYSNICGIYSPFTIEANYNDHMPDMEKPYTICHELSHLSGYMLEDEANFISYLGCMESENYAFKYSATLMAFIYVSNQLWEWETDDEYSEVIEMLNEQVCRDLQAQSDYWYSEEIEIEIQIGDTEINMSDVSSTINDNYLQVNGLEEGVASYDHVTDLLLAYYYSNKKS